MSQGRCPFQNKFISFSDCGGHHHEQSARFGWRWYEDTLQVLAYVYNRGELSFELMGNVSIDEEVRLNIHIESDQYLFSGDGLNTVSIARTSECEAGENYWLWPYFGGDETAPHEIKVRLKRTELD